MSMNCFTILFMMTYYFSRIESDKIELKSLNLASTNLNMLLKKNSPRRRKITKEAF